MNGELILIIISLIISGLSFGVSFLTFWLNRRSVQFKRDQESQMVVLASRAVILWEQLQNIVTVKVHDVTYDPFIFESLRKNALRFEDSLQKAIGLGLWSNLIGNKPGSTLLYSTFTQELLDSASSQENNINDWTGMHLLMGMIRTIEACERYRVPSVSEITKRVYANITENLKEHAWSYLTKEAERTDKRERLKSNN